MRDTLLRNFFMDFYDDDIKHQEISKHLNFAGCSKKDIEMTYDSSKSVLMVKTKDDCEHFKRYTMYVDNGVYDVDNISAKMDNGLLKVDIPLKEKHKDLIQISVN